VVIALGRRPLQKDFGMVWVKRPFIALQAACRTPSSFVGEGGSKIIIGHWEALKSKWLLA
jgi:hypothetical protein